MNWIEFVKKYAKDKGISYKEALKKASEPYKKMKEQEKKKKTTKVKGSRNETTVNVYCGDKGQPTPVLAVPQAPVMTAPPVPAPAPAPAPPKAPPKAPAKADDKPKPPPASDALMSELFKKIQDRKKKIDEETEAKGSGIKSEVQSIHFSNKVWNINTAKKWLQKHNYKPIKTVDKTKTELRYRITEPSQYKKFVTMKSGKHGVNIILGLGK